VNVYVNAYVDHLFSRVGGAPQRIPLYRESGHVHVHVGWVLAWHEKGLVTHKRLVLILIMSLSGIVTVVVMALKLGVSFRLLVVDVKVLEPENQNGIGKGTEERKDSDGGGLHMTLKYLDRRMRVNPERWKTNLHSTRNMVSNEPNLLTEERSAG
jgi:hypothetical protein